MRSRPASSSTTGWEIPTESYHAHFDCFSGAAGDMLLGSCLDASGADMKRLIQHITYCIEQGMPELRGQFKIGAKKVWRGGMGSIAAIQATVYSRYGNAPAPVPARQGSNPQRGYSSSDSRDSYGRSHSHSHNHHHRGGSGWHDSETDSDGEMLRQNRRAKSGEPMYYRRSQNPNDPSDPAGHPARNLTQIRNMLVDSSEKYIPRWVRDRAIATFEELATAEAWAHGAASVDAIHFHEVGGIDSIVDTVGTLLALFFLGVRDVTCSRMPVGEGMVWTDHGMMPVPAPAALRLLVGMPTCPGPPGLTGELVTPTGAALLRCLTKSSRTFGKEHRPPTFTIRKVGNGAGTKDFEKHPNICRLYLGDTVVTRDKVTK